MLWAKALNKKNILVLIDYKRRRTLGKYFLIQDYKLCCYRNKRLSFDTPLTDEQAGCRSVINIESSHQIKLY
jgi:hypothetical protein